MQIVHDTFSEACIRINQEERQKMKDFFGMDAKINLAVNSYASIFIKIVQWPLKDTYTGDW